MSFMQWRRYNFFDIKLVKEPETGQDFTYLKDLRVTCSSSGRSLLVFGDSNGFIHTVTRQSLAVSTFQAFKISVEHVQQMRQNALLVAVGADEAGINPVIKVWNQDKQDMHGEPLCVRTARAVIGIKPASVCAFRVNDNMTLMAVGFDDGKVLLLRGDISRGRQAKQSIYSFGDAPVTGIEFQGSSYMFVATTVSTHSVATGSGKVTDPSPMELDKRGCKPECSAITEPRRDKTDKSSKDLQFIVGCDEALYMYQWDGMGPCLAFEADKVIVSWFRSYLVCVVSDNDKTIINVYDINNKYVAYSTPLEEITHVLPNWGGGELVVVTRQGKIFALTEKSTEDRLGVLFRRNQYELAVKIANNNNYDGIVDIFRQYGDHLYAKGDHDGAVTQYIKTIGRLEESYVIRKLLDAQKIKQLTDYLQALHKKGLAKEDHTTLLINCYTNIKQVEILREFIKTSDLQFDAEIAIKVCRGSELYEEALYLAEKHKLTDFYLKIQLENLKKFEEAIKYIERRPFDEAEENMEKYGKVLMDNSPEATTSLLTRLCTNFEGRKAPAEKFIHIFVNNPPLLKSFLQQIIHELGEKFKLSPIIYNTLLELELQEYLAETNPSKQIAKEVEIMSFLKEKKNCYDTDLALVLCQINNFKHGILHLYEKAELYHQILSHYSDNEEYENIIEICSRFGDQDNSLWLHALQVFAHTNEQGNTSQYFMTVLDHIEKHHLLPAIMVVAIAAKSKTATLSLVKEYLVRHLSSEGEKIRAAEESIKLYKKETEKIREHMDNLKHNPKVFQESKCSGCKCELELPSVHFLCGHSFHLNCFENYSDSNGCPSCSPQNQRVVEQKQLMEDAMLTLDSDFRSQFQESDDVLATVADFFAKGVFKTIDPATEELLCFHADEQTVKPQPKNIYEKPSAFPTRATDYDTNPKPSLFDKPPIFGSGPKEVEPAKSIFDKPDVFLAKAPAAVSKATPNIWEKPAYPPAAPRQKPQAWKQQFNPEPAPANRARAAEDNPFEKELNPFEEDESNPFGKEDSPVRQALRPTSRALPDRVRPVSMAPNPFGNEGSPVRQASRPTSTLLPERARAASAAPNPFEDGSNPFGEE